ERGGGGGAVGGRGAGGRIGEAGRTGGGRKGGVGSPLPKDAAEGKGAGGILNFSREASLWTPCKPTRQCLRTIIHHAARVRKLASYATTPAVKQHLEEVAGQYARLAERVDSGRPPAEL